MLSHHSQVFCESNNTLQMSEWNLYSFDSYSNIYYYGWVRLELLHVLWTVTIRSIVLKQLTRIQRPQMMVLVCS